MGNRFFQVTTAQSIWIISKNIRKSKFYILLFISALFLLNSCSNLKYLAEDEKLYTYTWFSQNGFGKIKDQPLKAYELYTVGKVQTNRPFIGMPRTNLLVYNYWKPTGTWGPRHYVHRVWAKPPVLLESVNPEFRMKVMQQRLYEMGHFDSNVGLDLKYYGKDDKKVRAKYIIDFYPAYTYRNYSYMPKNTSVDELISGSLNNTLIESGKWYWVRTLELERNRVSNFLRDNGYYYFNPNYLFFHVDTAKSHKRVDLNLVLKSNIPYRSLQQFTIRHVNVKVRSDNPNHSDTLLKQPVIYKRLEYDDPWEQFKPKRIVRGISLTPGNQYSLTDQMNTTRFLQGYDVFKSVNITFETADTISRQLDATVELLPRKPMQLGINTTFSTKSNDFVGPAAEVSLAHINLFKGAEKLVLKVDGGFEWQKRSKRQEYDLGFNSYEIGSQLQLVAPRVMVPFRTPRKSMKYVSKTHFTLGYRSLKRVQFYTIDVSQFKFGYHWRINEKHEYSLDPVSFDYLHVPKKSDDFEAFLNFFPQIAKSFEEQVIPGSMFSYTYSSSPKHEMADKIYLNTTVDLAGNMASLFIQGKGNSLDQDFEPGLLFGIPYAQYFKLNSDIRYYLYISEKKQLAARLFAGFGAPYGNSSVLPFSKQYFTGGSQDIRAFYARSIGPGSYFPAKNDIYQGGFIDQTGDIKLLANVEFRFPLSYRTGGAFFVDAGNVWLWNTDEKRPGGEFRFNRFMHEMAVGSGFGLRFDFDYFIFRIDAAIPLRKPYLTKGDNWIFNNSGFWGDYVLSLAVGYPF